METNKVLSALSYFSIIFAAILFPLILYFVTSDPEVKGHAKKALFSHLIPMIPIPFIISGVLIEVFANGGEFPFFAMFFVGVSVILSIIVLIWNIIRGIKVLAD